MLGLVCYRDGRGESGVRTLGGVRFCAVRVARGTGLRAALSARRAAKYLRDRGVRCAVFPPGYPFARAFAARGIAPPPEQPLRACKAAEIVLCAMAQLHLPPSARIALVSSRPSGTLERAALSLVRPVRYLTLCTPSGERLGRMLRWDCGVSAHIAVRDEMLCADLAVSFDDAAPCCACPVLPLADEALRVTYRAPLPEGGASWDAGQLLFALFSAGALRAQDIAVEAVEFPPQTR